METAITALLVIGILILSILGLSERSIAAQATISEASRLLQERAGDRARTDLTPLGVTTTPLGDYVEVRLKNTGDTKLADFDQWDVIMQYTDGLGGYHVQWYGYPIDWTQQIYLAASPPTAEVFEPGIFNPGEELVLRVRVSPGVGSNTTNLATVGSPNGITATAVFTR
ncbi:MAG TPA: hypothetical protein VJG32_07440 [Anaerolineae bacterium]|nr:hypothetical protein [Anaerolineae bacterium]